MSGRAYTPVIDEIIIKVDNKIYSFHDAGISAQRCRELCDLLGTEFCDEVGKTTSDPSLCMLLRKVSNNKAKGYWREII